MREDAPGGKSESREHPDPRRERRVLWILLALAFLLRAPGIRWALPYLLGEFDERAIVEMAAGMFGGDPTPSQDRYPAFFIRLVHLAFQPLAIVLRAQGAVDSPAALIAYFDAHVSPFYLIARGLSVVLSLWGIYLTYRLARLAGGPREALAAGLILATNPLHLELSHSARTDATLATLCAGALLYAALYATGRRTTHLLASGIFAGLALSTKYTAVMLLPPLVLAAAGAFGSRPAGARSPWWPVAVAIALPAAVFALINPRVVQDLPSIAGWFQHVSERVGTAESIGRPPSPVFYSRLLLTHSYGLGLLLLAAAGFSRLWKTSRAVCWVLAAYALPQLLLYGLSRPAFERYLLPVVPCLAVLSAAGVPAVASRLGRPAALCLAVALLTTLPYTIQEFLVGGVTRDTRIQSTDWIAKNHPAPGRVAIVADTGYEIPLPLPQHESLMGRKALTGQVLSRPKIWSEAVDIARRHAAGGAGAGYHVTSIQQGTVETLSGKGFDAVLWCDTWKKDAPPEPKFDGYRVARRWGPSWARTGPYITALVPDP